VPVMRTMILMARRRRSGRACTRGPKAHARGCCVAGDDLEPAEAEGLAERLEAWQ
jgi:hypothetical protein